MKPNVILPGSTLGVLGGGQLGRMFAFAAQQLGYEVIAYTPETDSPISKVCKETICAPFEDRDALSKFAKKVKVITLEFENIPSSTINFLAEHTPVHPGENVLHIAQNRLREKTFLQDNGFPIAPFLKVCTKNDLTNALNQIGMPAVLKTAGFGYDGKGQSIINSLDEVDSLVSKFANQEFILEKYINLDKEISIVGARNASGETAFFGPIENRHKNHILDLSLIPASVSNEHKSQAIEITESIMSSLNVVGLLCVEFFITSDSKLLVNEMAPRPHNSGHYSINACPVSQFEQQVRAITGLPLGCTDTKSAAAMANLLGDLWQPKDPNWERALQLNNVHLHLYGKSKANPGRKMGHLTACADTVEEALQAVQAARNSL